MGNNGYPENLPAIFTAFKRAIEMKDENAIVECFCEDCRIEILEYKLSGHSGVRKWLKWMYKHMKKMRHETLDGMWDGERLYEEFYIRGVLHNGVEVRAKQARIVIIEDGRIKHLRSYFDRLAFADSLIHGNTFQKVVKKFIDKSMGELTQ